MGLPLCCIGATQGLPHGLPHGLPQSSRQPAGCTQQNAQCSRHAELAVGVVEPLTGRVRVAAAAAAANGNRGNTEADRHVRIR